MTRFVRMMPATPRLAVIAISWMTWIRISRMVTNPIVSLRSAIPPGTSRRRNAIRAAASGVAPSNTSSRTALTIWTP